VSENQFCISDTPLKIWSDFRYQLFQVIPYFIEPFTDMLWSPTFFQLRTDQRLENFNAAREYSMMVVILQQLK